MQLSPIPPLQFYGAQGPSLLRHDVPPPNHSLNRSPLSPHNGMPPAIGPSLNADPGLWGLRSAPSSEQNQNTPPQGAAGTVAPVYKVKKSHEEFPLPDLDQLLCTMIEVNLYMSPRKQIREKWKDITQKVQAASFCTGRKADTLKNKVMSLLNWAKGGKKLTGRTSIGREAERDPAGFASVSGKIDTIANMRREAKVLNDMQHEDIKKVQDQQKSVGENLWISMMLGHASTQQGKHKASKSFEALCDKDENDSSDKENSVSEVRMSSSASSVSLKRVCMSQKVKMTAKIDAMMDLMKDQVQFMCEEASEQKEFCKAMLDIHARAVDMQKEAVAQQSASQAALLDVLRQGLLGNAHN